MNLREVWQQGGTVFGGWCVIPGAFAAEVMGRVGFDYICVDCQHGMIGYDQMLTMLQAVAISGTAAIVRVPWNRPEDIMRALDSGAQGVLVPMVNSREEAMAAVRACRYPPEGYRSWGPVRASLGVPDYTPETANKRVLCAVMVETVEGVEHLENIVSVPGVDVVYAGPADLAVTWGMKPSMAVEEPRHLELIERILHTCQKHGVVAGMHCGGAVLAARWAKMGFRMITVNTDIAFLRGATTTALSELRGLLASGPRRSKR